MSDIQILVLEDHEDEASLYCRMIKDMGYACSYVTNSEQAFGYLDKKNVDILFLDLYLKEDLTGIQLIPKFKKLHPGIVIIVLTHSMEMQDSVDAIKGGAMDYLTKPFDVGLFKQRIEIAVDKVRYEKLKKSSGRNA
jgi:DNA-binding NtrC family response regulator